MRRIRNGRLLGRFCGSKDQLYGRPLGPAELKNDGWHRRFQKCNVFVSWVSQIGWSRIWKGSPIELRALVYPGVLVSSPSFAEVKT